MCADQNGELPSDGESLDALLREARWPSAAPPAVSRLAQHWEKVWTARRRRDVLLRRAAACAIVAAVLAGATVGWFRLRPNEESIADVKQPPALAPERSMPPTERGRFAVKGPQPIDTHHEARRPTQIAQTATPDLAPFRAPNELEELMLAAADRQAKRRSPAVKVGKPSPKRRIGAEALVKAPGKTGRKSTGGRDHTDAELAIVRSAVERVAADSQADVAKIGAELRTSSPNHEQFLLQTLNRGTQPQQIAALRLLAEVGSSASVGPLLRAAEETPLHRAAVEALARLADPSLVGELARMESDGELQRTLIAALLARGEPASLREFLGFVENERTADAALAAAQTVKKPPMDLLFSTLSQPLEVDRIAAARIIGQIDGAATTQRLIAMVESGVNRHEACIALLSSRGREATQYVNAAAERDPTLAAILSGARLFAQLDHPPRS
jgi:hypothetical protein